jgi:hypothetical protein
MKDDPGPLSGARPGPVVLLLLSCATSSRPAISGSATPNGSRGWRTSSSTTAIGRACPRTFFCRSGLPSDTEQVPKSLAPKGRASAPEPAGAFPGRQSSFDFRAQVCHSAPMERHAFGLRFRPNVLAPQKGFRVASIVNEFKEA